MAVAAADGSGYPPSTRPERAGMFGEQGPDRPVRVTLPSRPGLVGGGHPTIGHDREHVDEAAHLDDSMYRS